MTKKRKPTKIEAGKAYKVAAFGARTWGESDLDKILYVSKIEGAKQRICMVTMIYPEGNLGWNAISYTDLLRKVHSEAPMAIN